MTGDDTRAEPAPEPVVVAAALRDVLARRAPQPLEPWIGEAVAAADAGDDQTLLARFAAAGRVAGAGRLVADDEDRARLRAAGIDWTLDPWTRADALRAIVLLRASAVVPPTALVALVEDCYRGGDTRERHAVLRALPLLAAPKRFAACAADACRASVQTVFEAIACENPYPAAYFEDARFAHMVMKSVFTGVALARIVGLRRRITPALARMARDYASERAAAGRPVPPDLALLTGDQ